MSELILECLCHRLVICSEIIFDLEDNVAKPWFGNRYLIVMS